jgi:hypothetical protein
MLFVCSKSGDKPKFGFDLYKNRASYQWWFGLFGHDIASFISYVIHI